MSAYPWQDRRSKGVATTPVMVQHGKDETPSTMAHLEGHRLQNISASLLEHSGKGPKVCVGLHLFNSAPIISELLTYVANTPPPFEVLVHIDSKSRDFELERQSVTSAFPDATLITTEDNRGADIGGKLLVIQDILLRGPQGRCPTVLFVHSKTSDWWRKALLNPLVGTPEVASKNLDILLSKPEIGQLGSADCMVRELAKRDFVSGAIVHTDASPEAETWIATHMECNFPIVQKYCNRLGVSIPQQWKDIDFVAGSIFWVKTDLLTQVFDTRNGQDDPLHLYMELETDYQTNKIDCQRAHGLERFFGWITAAKGYQIRWLQSDNPKDNNK